MNNPNYFPVILGKSGNTDVVMMLKADDLTSTVMSVDEAKKLDDCKFNFDSIKYSDEENVELAGNTGKTTCVLVYDDIKNGFYGLVSAKIGKVKKGAKINLITNIFWIPKVIIDNPTEKEKERINKLLNGVARQLHVIDDNFEYKFDSGQRNVRITEMVSDSYFFTISIDKYNEKYLGIVEEPTQEVEEPTQEVEEPTQEVEEPTQEVEEPTQEVPKQHCNFNVELLQSMIDNIVNREIELKKKEEELSKREVDVNAKEAMLNDREDELNEREYYLVRESEMNSDIDVIDATVVVDSLADMKREKIQPETKFLYETLLKVAKHGDRITIPFDVYKQFSVVLKSKALDRNSDYTKFTQLAQIKTDTSQLAGIIAVIEIDNTNPVKLSIISEYGVQRFDASKVQKFETEYRQWRRNRSYFE